MKTAIQFFMAPGDELSFSELLKAKYPETHFIEVMSPTPQPLERLALSDCANPYGTIAIWNRQIWPELPSRKHNEAYEWATNGPALQFVRSRFENGILTSGILTAGVADDRPYLPEMKTFVQAVWRMIRKGNACELRCVSPESHETINPNVKGYSVWPEALHWCKSSGERLLKDMGTFNYYLPK